MGFGAMPAAVMRMQAIEVVDAECDVAMGIAVRVGLGAVLVERELDLEIGFGVPQIDQREAVEVEPVGDIEAQCGAVEGDRSVQIRTRTIM